MESTARYWILTLITALALAGCGPSSDDGGGSATAGGEDDEGFDDLDDEPGDSTEGHQSAIELIGINPPEQPWAEMSHGDREMDMVARFHPVFREIFMQHDAEEFRELGCETCHGEDMQAQEFEMPSAHLPPVPAAGSEAYEAMRAEHPEMTRFMEEDVTPPMQTMLGMPDFGCNGCHPTAD